MPVADALLTHEAGLWRDPVARELVPVLCAPTGTSSAGFPYLEHPAFVRFRDWVPHILAAGLRTWETLDRIEQVAADVYLAPEHRESLGRSAKVVRQVVRTAAITAPPDLWLLRHVWSSLRALGLSDALASGSVVDPDAQHGLNARQLRIDLDFLLSRGYLVRHGTAYRLDDHVAARQAAALPQLATDVPSDASAAWAAVFSGRPSAADVDGLRALHRGVVEDEPRGPGRWAATASEIVLGHRLVPLVLGLRATGRTGPLLKADRVDAICPAHPELEAAARGTLLHVGAISAGGALTPIGRRILARGPGPFGIIQAYHPYMADLPAILRGEPRTAHVQRSANIAASQDANHGTFRQANDALDRFSADTGFRWTVFIEHAIGRGEATRQRYERSGDDGLAYVGADLEDAAIDAAMAERDAGRLPAAMSFVRQADIGRPELLVDAIRARGIDPEGAAMIVGNGFHEVRDRTDDEMVQVFRGYQEAGILLLFTEESALSVDDLLHTAWNTYHAGFRYVHSRSGQGLRPATPSPPSVLGQDLPASWTECATRAGYVRAERYCSRSRTIYPYTPPSGHNPAISVNHFFVPARIAQSTLGSQ